MRALIRKEINLDAPINLESLKPFERIVVAIQCQIRETKFYKLHKQKSHEEAYKRKVVREERLKDSMLVFIYGELVKNNYFKKENSNCESLVLAINHEYEEELYEVIKSKDFLSFDLKILPFNNDMLLSFDNLPILVEVRKKIL